MLNMECSDIVSVLRDAQSNNSREWYMQQKEVFREIHAFLNNLYFIVASKLYKKVNIDVNSRKSISRPYNDQRFGNRPYLRENLWVTFQKKECPAPAFFIEFSPCGIRIGMGYYSATPTQMRDLRTKIDSNPKGFSDMLEKILLDKDIHVIGEQYKKKQYASNYEGLLGEIYSYRSVYFQKIIPVSNWNNIEYISTDTFVKLVPMYKVFVEES